MSGEFILIIFAWAIRMMSCFFVHRLARVPYICEGDQKNGAYILDDAVFVLSPASSDSGDEIAEMHAEGGGI